MNPEPEGVDDAPWTNISLTVASILGVLAEIAIWFWLVPAWLSARSDAMMYSALLVGCVGVVLPFLYQHYVLKPYLDSRKEAE